jgi:hypothetical protein
MILISEQELAALRLENEALKAQNQKAESLYVILAEKYTAVLAAHRKLLAELQKP